MTRNSRPIASSARISRTVASVAASSNQCTVARPRGFAGSHGRSAPSRAGARPDRAGHSTRAARSVRISAGSGTRPNRGLTTKEFTAIPWCVLIEAERTSSACSASTPAVRYSVPAASGAATYHLAVDDDRKGTGLGEFAAQVVERRGGSGSGAPRTTARARRARSATSPAFQSLQAAGGRSRSPSATASACSRSSSSTDRRRYRRPSRPSADRRGRGGWRCRAAAGGGGRGRGSSRRPRRRSPSAAAIGGRVLGADDGVVAAGSPCRCRAAARRRAAGPGGRPRGCAAPRWRRSRAGAGRR